MRESFGCLLKMLGYVVLFIVVVLVCSKFVSFAYDLGIRSKTILTLFGFAGLFTVAYALKFIFREK